MKIAYLAPELPALSATFVYNEILQLQSMGTEIVPFAVHKATATFQDPDINKLQKKVQYLYGRSKLSAFKDHIYISFSHTKRYFKALKSLSTDVYSLGLFSRTAVGLVYRFIFSASLARALVNQECSHIHVHFAHIPTDIAMYAATMAGIPFSVTAHANDLFERGWLLAKKVERSAFFATISEFNKCFLIALGADEGKIKIIRCGVEFKQFFARQNFQPTQEVMIGLVGRLVEKKGVDVLINALKLLKDHQFPIVLQIAGSGPLLGELSQLAIALDLTDSDIEFLGALPHKDVASFIKSLDVFILPCKQDKNGDMDGIPVVLMEAMLSGVPVISTRITGIPELVIDGETGLIAEPNDVKSLVQAIKIMIENSPLREQMTRHAIDKVKADFSLQSNTRILNTLFENVTKLSKCTKD